MTEWILQDDHVSLIADVERWRTTCQGQEEFVMASKITPCLWFDGKAEEAAKFYTSLFPNSRIDKINRSPADTPSGPAGMVLTVDFTVAGQPFIGLNGGPDFKFNEAVSFSIDCEDHAAGGKYRDALIAGGGGASGVGRPQ